jgi:hypothetical protein
MISLSFRHIVIVLMNVALCACAPEQQSSKSEAAKVSRPNAAYTSLEGDWQVAGVDGETVIGIALTGNDETISWKPDCAGWSIAFRQDGTAIRFVNKNQQREEPRTVCAIGYPDRLPDIFRILPVLNRFEALGGKSIRLSGGGHVIDLERPLTVVQRQVPSLAGRWSVHTLDGNRLLKRSLVFVATNDFITWQPPCADQARAYAIENDRISVRLHPGISGEPPPPEVQAVPPRLVCTIALHPMLPSAFAAMEAATHVRPAANGAITMEGNGRDVTLIPLDSD